MKKTFLLSSITIISYINFSISFASQNSTIPPKPTFPTSVASTGQKPSTTTNSTIKPPTSNTTTLKPTTPNNTTLKPSTTNTSTLKPTVSNSTTLKPTTPTTTTLKPSNNSTITKPTTLTPSTNKLGTTTQPSTLPPNNQNTSNLPNSQSNVNQPSPSNNSSLNPISAPQPRTLGGNSTAQTNINSSTPQIPTSVVNPVNNTPTLGKPVLPTEQPTLITPSTQGSQGVPQTPTQTNSPTISNLPPMSSQIVETTTQPAPVKKKIIRKDPLLEKMNR